MENTGKPVTYAELKRRLKIYPTVSIETLDLEQTVLLNRISHHRYYDGLSVYAIEHTETCNLTNLAELPAAVSFNIVFEGQIDFSISGTPYQLGNHKVNGAECSCYVINRAEVFKRFLRRDQNVKHVNIFAERRWLENHAKTQEAQKTLQKIFKFHNILHIWQPSKSLIEKARKLFEHSPNALHSSLTMKSTALDLLGHCLEELGSLAESTEPNNQPTHLSTSNFLLKKNIDHLLLKRFSLEEMADSMDMSVSTLQRKFKAAYNITVNLYCRQQRLEIARRAMTIDGATIGEAAYLAGYNYPSNFISAFKKRFNQTPTELVKNSTLSDY